MTRLRGYAVFVAASGLIAFALFTLSEEVASGASEPGSYSFFRLVTVGVTVAVTTGSCVLVEIVRRMRRKVTAGSTTAAR